MTERTNYDRAITAVLAAQEQGRIIILADPGVKDRAQVVSDLAEFLLVALGINDN